MVVVVVGMSFFKKCWSCGMSVVGVSEGAVGGCRESETDALDMLAIHELE